MMDQALRVIGEAALPDGFALNRQILAQERQRRGIVGKICKEPVQRGLNLRLRPIIAAAVAVTVLSSIGKVGFIPVVILLPVNRVGEHRRLQRFPNLRKSNSFSVY
jgi:hypothetical protein